MLIPDLMSRWHKDCCISWGGGRNPQLPWRRVVHMLPIIMPRASAKSLTCVQAACKSSKCLSKDFRTFNGLVKALKTSVPINYQGVQQSIGAKYGIRLRPSPLNNENASQNFKTTSSVAHSLKL